ncbi:MAG: acyl-CoA synthetase [Deltaproteobacteria bacterium]|nr:acyl-CoA synthetase [Deltaproteobacteria bacterium]
MAAGIPEGYSLWRGIPEDYNAGRDLSDAVCARGLGHRVALYWENGAGARRVLTYQDLADQSSRFANVIAGLGIERGDRILLRVPNIPEFLVSALGANKRGALYIPTSTLFKEKEIAYRVRDAGARLVVTTPQLYPEVAHIGSECPTLDHVMVVPYLGAPAPPDAIDFEQSLAAASREFPPVATRHDDLAFIAYTSGTTGDPKGVTHYQRYPASYDNVVRWWYDFRPEDVVSCPSEIGWMLPVATFLLALRVGCALHMYHETEGPFRPEVWFPQIERYRISMFTAAPTVYRMLLTVKDAEARYDLRSLRHAVSAGEALPADTLAALQTRFGITPIDGIGMSECMVYNFNRVGEALRPGSCGKPGPGLRLALLDDELRPVPRGEPGVLCLRREDHPGIMEGYWGKPDKTSEILRGDWYVSGDVLVEDEDGYLWFQGRADDVIKVSGYRVSPFEVENILLSHPAVLEAAAVASPDPVRGNVLKAFVLLKEGEAGSEALAEELRKHCREQAAPFKTPRLIEFVTALPKTQSGKIKRKDLRLQESRK